MGKCISTVVPVQLRSLLTADALPLGCLDPEREADLGLLLLLLPKSSSSSSSAWSSADASSDSSTVGCRCQVSTHKACLLGESGGVAAAAAQGRKDAKL